MVLFYSDTFASCSIASDYINATTAHLLKCREGQVKGQKSDKHCGLSITYRSCWEKLFQLSHIRMYQCNTIYIKSEFWGQNHFRPIKREWNNKRIKWNSQAGDSEMSACLDSNKKCTRHIPLPWKPYQSSNWKQGHRTETLVFLQVQHNECFVSGAEQVKDQYPFSKSNIVLILLTHVTLMSCTYCI